MIIWQNHDSRDRSIRKDPELIVVGNLPAKITAEEFTANFVANAKAKYPRELLDRLCDLGILTPAQPEQLMQEKE